MAMVYVCNVSQGGGDSVERLPLPGDGVYDRRPFDPDISVRVRPAEEAYRGTVANAAAGEVERVPLPGREIVANTAHGVVERLPLPNYDWKGR